MKEYLDFHPDVKDSVVDAGIKTMYHLSLDGPLPDKVYPRLSSRTLGPEYESRAVPRISVSKDVLACYSGLATGFIHDVNIDRPTYLYRFNDVKTHKPRVSVLADSSRTKEHWLLPIETGYEPVLVATLTLKSIKITGNGTYSEIQVDVVEGEDIPWCSDMTVTGSTIQIVKSEFNEPKTRGKVGWWSIDPVGSDTEALLKYSDLIGCSQNPEVNTKRYDRYYIEGYEHLTEGRTIIDCLSDNAVCLTDNDRLTITTLSKDINDTSLTAIGVLTVTDRDYPDGLLVARLDVNKDVALDDGREVLAGSSTMLMLATITEEGKPGVTLLCHEAHSSSLQVEDGPSVMSLESGLDDAKYLYVLFVDNTVKRLPGEPYGYVAFSLDENPGALCSYSMTVNGFIKEPKSLFVGKSFSLYRTEITDDQYSRILSVVDELATVSVDTKSSMELIVSSLFLKNTFDTEDKKNAICSSFIMNVMDEINIKLFRHNRNAVQPYELAKSRKLQFVKRGLVKATKPKYL